MFLAVGLIVTFFIPLWLYNHSGMFVDDPYDHGYTVTPPEAPDTSGWMSDEEAAALMEEA